METQTATCPHCGAEVQLVNKAAHIAFHTNLARDIARLEIRAGIIRE